MALPGAAMVQNVFDTAIRTGAIREDDLFHETLVEVPGTTPRQYKSRYGGFTDGSLKSFQAVFLEDPDVVATPSR